VERPALNLPNPPSVKFDEIKLKVLHKHNADKYFNEIDSKGKEPVVVATTVGDYKKLAVNIAKLKVYIKTQQKIINAYRKYYESKKNGNKKEKN
jgi:hypothetical protein